MKLTFSEDYLHQIIKKVALCMCMIFVFIGLITSILVLQI